MSLFGDITYASPPEKTIKKRYDDEIVENKTLYGALTRCRRWGYTNTHITVQYMITHNTYSTQLFQLRFKVLPQLSGKVGNERERLNTVLKCGRPYPTSKVIGASLSEPHSLVAHRAQA